MNLSMSLPVVATLGEWVDRGVVCPVAKAIEGDEIPAAGRGESEDSGEAGLGSLTFELKLSKLGKSPPVSQS